MGQATTVNAAPVETGNSLFDQAWWLDAVAPGAWQAVTAEREGKVAARLAYVVSRRFGLTYLVQPPLTQALGPWLAEADLKESTRLAREKHLVEDLISALPRFDLFAQSFAPDAISWLPFHRHGFHVEPRITYRLDLADLDAVWSGF